MALAAQGFAGGRDPGSRQRSGPGGATVASTVRRLGVIQIDSVNVLARAHYLPLLSRLGAYDRSLLDAMSQRAPRALFEYWGHEASLLPVQAQPWFRWRMARAQQGAWSGLREVATRRPDLLDGVRSVVAEHGPLPAAHVERRLGQGRRPATGWGWRWSEVKRAVEFLFWAGELSAARRGSGFERWYDLPERVLPAAVLATPTPSEPDAVRHLVATASRALGVASLACLRDYFRLPADLTRSAVAELVEEGELVQGEVRGWNRAVYLHAKARVPRSMDAHALLAPFDPLVWERSRTESLFDFRYRLEIYTPAAARVHGYYVLPFLLGDRLVARVDLKADRQARLLLVQAAWAEPGCPAETATALATSLHELADWLALRDVVVVGPGDLAPAIARVLASGNGVG